MINVRNIFIPLLVIIALSVSVTSCSNSSPANYRAQKTTSTPVLVHKSLNLVNGIITVKSGGWYSTSFTVSFTSFTVDGVPGVSPQNERVVGSFTATGGSGNDIIALILDDMSYTNWSNGHTVNTFYNSGQITVANINIPITTSGTYYLIFSNTFSPFTSKEVNANVNVEWDVLEYK